MTNGRIFAAGLLIVWTIGCNSDTGGTNASSRAKLPSRFETLLRSAERFELLSLDSQVRQADPEEGFQGWKILGETLVADSAQRAKLVDAFKAGVEENEGIAAACFIPRHGIRLIDGEKTYEFVICFECFAVQVYEDGNRGPSLLITDSPRPLFNKVLADAEIDLAD